jgi:hypothetical protein
MMVPAEGKYFFAGDVFKGLGAKQALPEIDEPENLAPGQSH